MYGELLRNAQDYHVALPPLRPPMPWGRGHSPALRLRKCRESVLCFRRDACVLSTNNHAVHESRVMKLRMKTSGSFRS